MIVLCAMLTACGGDGARLRMDAVDSIIELQPDSALVLLQSIESSELTSSGLQARHALLTTQARVKTDRLTTADTAALPLLDFYRDNGNDFDRMRAAFYKAVIYSTQNNYRKQIFNLCEAKTLAEKLNNNYWLAKIFELEADIFQNNFNYKDVVELRRSAIENYRKAEKQRNVDFAYMDLAYSLHSVNQNDTAFYIIDRMINKAYNASDTVMEFYGLTIKSHMCINTGKYNEADSIRRRQYSLKGDSLPACFDDLYLDSFIELFCKGDMNGRLLVEVRNSLSSKVDSARYYYLLTNLYFKRGDFDRSRSAVDSLLTVNAAVVNEVLHQSVVSEQLNYSNLLISEARNKNKLLMIIIVFAIIITISTILYLHHLKAIRIKKDNLISIISGELAEHEANIKKQQLKYDLLFGQLKQETENSDSGMDNAASTDGADYTRIFELYSNQWGAISNICTTYLNTTDKTEKNSGYKKVTRLLAELGAAKNLDELVGGINRAHAYILDDIRSIDKSISANDIYMFALTSTGASIRIISIILNSNQSTLYNRRDRIVAKIKDSTLTSKEKILSFLEI